MKPLIIDVREPLEYKSGHVEGAINIPPQKLISGAAVLDGVSKDAPLILYCVSGSRSNASMHILTRLGFTNLTNGINRRQVEKKLGL